MLAPWPIGDKRTCRSDLCNNARSVNWNFGSCFSSCYLPRNPIKFEVADLESEIVFDYPRGGSTNVDYVKGGTEFFLEKFFQDVHRSFSVNLSKSRRVKISDPEPGPVFGIEDLSVEPVLMSGDLPLFPSEVNQSTSDSNQRKVGKRTEEFQTPI